MTGLILLDSAPLGYFCNSKNRSTYNLFKKFVRHIGFSVGVPEIIDYEVRRNFELERLNKAISLLSQFQKRKQIISLNSLDLIKAAELWAWCRKKGQSTTENKGLDIDVILVSQALSQLQLFDKVIILTVDTGDLSVFCEFGVLLWDWNTALTDCDAGTAEFL